MERNKLLSRIKVEAETFFEEIGKASEPLYLLLLTVYAAIFFMLKFAWDQKVEKAVEIVRYGMLGVVIWGAAAYLFFIIAAWKNLWKKNIPLLLTGVGLIAAAGFFSAKMSTNIYGVVMDIFFCLIAYKKDYRKMLLCLFGTAVLMLILAGCGMAAGITLDIQKPFNESPGHSLGINYPNTWGYLAFLAMLLAWYLFLRGKWIITFFLFWGVSVFMYCYISCRTITGMSVVFPFFAVVVDWIEKRKKSEESNTEVQQNRNNSAAVWIVTLIPFLVFAVMLILSLNVEWVHSHFYHTKLHNLAMRFVQGGLYFRTYGFPLVGNPYRANQITYVNVNGEFEEVGILDSSFAAYIIMRGMVWMFCTLLWLCFANRKAMKERNYAIPLVGTFILLFATMERPGLEMWYNFVMLYPLAKAAGEQRLFPAKDVPPDETDAES